MVSVVLSPSEGGQPGLLDQLMAWGAPRSGQMGTSVCWGLENTHQGWAGLACPKDFETGRELKWREHSPAGEMITIS